MNIDSKLHRMIDLVSTEEGARRADKNSTPNEVAVIRLRDDQREKEERELRLAQSLPRFVFDHDMIDMASTDEATQSALDMVRHGVFCLPFPDVVVETHGITNTGQHMHGLTVLRENGPNTFLAKPWMLLRGGFDLENLNREFVACSGMNMEISLSGETTEDALYRNEIQAAWPCDKTTRLQFVAVANLAVTCATVILQTLGLRREMVDVGEKFNRRRERDGRAPVLPYVRVGIGKVYRRAEGDEADDYVPGKSPRPHWRRGHARRVWCGPGRTEVRTTWIPARMVAMAAAPEYRVSK